MKPSVKREHESVTGGGTVSHATAHSRPQTPLATADEAAARRSEQAPNPLWAITIGMAVFFAACAALMMVSI